MKEKVRIQLRSFETVDGEVQAELWASKGKGWLFVNYVVAEDQKSLVGWLSGACSTICDEIELPLAFLSNLEKELSRVSFREFVLIYVELVRQGAVTVAALAEEVKNKFGYKYVPKEWVLSFAEMCRKAGIKIPELV